MDAEMIDNLAFKSGIHEHSMNDPDPQLNGWIVSPEKLDKFAELIIQECIRIGSISFQNDNSIVPVFPSKQIKHHFGVE